MARAAKLDVVVDAKTQGLEKGYRRATGATKKFTNDTNRLGDTLKGKLGAAFAGVAVGAFAAQVGRAAAEMVKFASDADEAANKVNVVFGNYGRSMINDWADNTVTKLGLSSGAALEAAGTFGNLLTAFGVGQGKAADMSKELVQLAADLASFNNTSIDDALNALRSGLSGEMEPLKRFGVTLSDVRLRAEAAALGIETTTAALDPQTKSLAAYSLIMKDTAGAQGDFERTSDGLANTQRILEAAVKDAKEEIGVGLLKATEEAVEALGGSGGLADAIADAADEASDFTYGLGVLAGDLLGFSQSLSDATNGLVDFGTVIRGSLAVGTAGLSESLIRAAQGLSEVGEKAAEADAQTQANAEAQAALEAGYRANTKAAYAMADANNAVAESAAEAAKGTVAAAIATGQVPSAAKFGQRFDVAAMLDGIGKAGRTAARGVGSSTKALEDNSKAVKRYEDLNKDFTTKWKTETEKRVEALRTEVRAWEDLAGSVSGAFGSSLASAFENYTDHVAKAAEVDAALAKAIAEGDKEGQAKAQAQRAALGHAEDYVEAWLKATEYDAAVKAKIGAAMAGLLESNPELREGARALTDQLLTMDPAAADAAISKLINEETLPKIAGRLQELNATDNTVSAQFADLFYGSGVAGAAASVAAVEEEMLSDKSLKKLRKAGKAAGKTLGDALAEEVRRAVANALRDAQAARASAGSRIDVGGSTRTARSTSTTTPISITVNAGVGDPISIARSVENVLRTARHRTGGAV